jgi:tetratricopeptide (TPR) repeat protein
MGKTDRIEPSSQRSTAALCTAVALTIAFVMAACSRSSGRIEDARRFLDTGDAASATIELKNVLQANPNSGEARLLLGRALFAVGDVLGAEAELRRALEARHPDQEVLPHLARALVALQRFGPLLKEFGTTELSAGASAAEFKTQLAAALMATGALGQAQAMLAAAMALAEDVVSRHADTEPGRLHGYAGLRPRAQWPAAARAGDPEAGGRHVPDLTRLAKLGPGFAPHKEVAQLLRQLGS